MDFCEKIKKQKIKMRVWCILLITATLAVGRINSISSENCSNSAGVILINRTNNTIPKEYIKDFDEISKVLASAQAHDNSDPDEILPHNFIPEISAQEKGEINLAWCAYPNNDKAISPSLTKSSRLL